MQRNLLIVAMMVLAAVPAASAHFPPGQPNVGPHLNCQDTPDERKYHDYQGPVTGFFVLVTDGNIEDCPKKMDITWGPIFDPTLPPCTTPPPGGLQGEAPWCEEEKIANWPLADYDGEYDWGYGGAFLFVRTGDGVTDGVTACYGWPAIGHHSASIYAFDDLTGKGPEFSVTADYSRPGEEGTPDCGDSLVEPCDPLPPEPSPQPFPVNVVIDTINGVLYSIFGPGGAGCNVLDNAFRCHKPNEDGVPKDVPNRCTVPFGDGADGTYVVFIENDLDQPHFPLGGHVWTA